MVGNLLVSLLAIVANYILCAAPFWQMERLRPAVPGIACWRTPLGLGAGLVLHAAHALIGILLSLVVCWFVFGDVRLLLSAADGDPRPPKAALIGTLGGALGGTLLAAYAYGRRRAGPAAAGLVPVPAGPALQLAAAAAVLLAGMSVLYNIAFAVVFDRVPGSAEPLVDLVRGADTGTIWLAMLVFASVVMAPVLEETVYRGVIYRAFRERGGVPLAMTLSGLLFSLSHYQPEFVLPLWVFGVALAWVYERTGSLVTPMLAHAIYNGFALSLDLTS